MTLNPTVRWLLGGVAAVVGFLAAFDPFGLSHTAQGIVACASVLFAALGIVPPQAGGTQKGVVAPRLRGDRGYGLVELVIVLFVLVLIVVLLAPRL